MKLALIIVLAFAIFACQVQQASPSVTASDQKLDSTIVVDRVVASEPGWIVIHADDEGPGQVIGYASVAQGVNENVEVSIDTEAATETLYAMLHIDSGTVGTYEFPGEDTPVMFNNQVVLDSFTVSTQSLEMVEMINVEFVPETLEIDQGDTVEFINRDSVLHTVTGFGIDRDVGPGESLMYTFNEAGTFEYECTIHPGMRGTVIVR